MASSGLPVVRFRARAPGKVILHGEHAVVYGKPAVAVAIDCYTTVEIDATDGLCRWTCLDYQVDIASDDLRHLCDRMRSFLGDIVAADPDVIDLIDNFLLDHFQALSSPTSVTSLKVILFLFAAIASRFQCSRLVCSPFLLVVQTELPIGAGLGSSASFSAAVAAAFLHASVPMDTTEAGQKSLLNSWSYQAERIIHGNPSGLDNFVVTSGGAVRYELKHQQERLSTPTQDIIVVDTGVVRSTKELVQRVRVFIQEQPDEANRILDAIHSLTDDAVALLKLEPPILSPLLIVENQRLLVEMQVGHETIDRVCTIATKHGLAAKLTGAGGGGCVICIVPDDLGDTAQFTNEIAKHGFSWFKTRLSNRGVVIEEA